jgi:hypothetical protein
MEDNTNEKVEEIVNKVLGGNGDMASKHFLSICKEIAMLAMQEGFEAGYAIGFKSGNWNTKLIHENNYQKTDHQSPS